MGLRKGEAGITKGGGLLKYVAVVEEGLTLKKDTSDRDATKEKGRGTATEEAYGTEVYGTGGEGNTQAVPISL